MAAAHRAVSGCHACRIQYKSSVDNVMPQANRRLREQDCLAVLAGRGALTRPWLFEEWRMQREFFLTAEERVGVYRCPQCACPIYCCGVKAARRALSWVCSATAHLG